MAERPSNFNAGPAMMPEAVLEEAAQAVLDFNGTGISIKEIGHRSDEFLSVITTAEDDIRELLGIPDSYKVLFLPAGATGEFGAVAANLAEQSQGADYVVNGNWGEKAFNEGQIFLDAARIAAKAEPATYVPERADWDLSDDAAYVHITSNETIQGVAFPEAPEVPGLLVADMSSDILSQPIDVDRYDVIYAGAQKNMGQAGVTLTIVRDSLLDRAREKGLSSVLNWKKQAAAGSLLNTPPVEPIYTAGLMFKWVKANGGAEAMKVQNDRKAGLLYGLIDGSEGFYTNPVEPQYRSRMNIPFLLRSAEMEAGFLSQAHDEGLDNLEGHRDVGGLRASIYNAMSEERVEALVDFMKAFAEAHA